MNNAATSESVRSSNSITFHCDDTSTPDVDKNTGKKKRGGSKITAGGLRQFSAIVCSKLKNKGRTTYNEVADEIISELPGIYGETEALSEVQLINIAIYFIIIISNMFALLKFIQKMKFQLLSLMRKTYDDEYMMH